MKYETYISQLKKKPLKEQDSYAFLLSTLPPIEMLIKLVERKQNGKKPFSPEFNYEVSRAKIDEIKDDIFSYLDGKEVDVKCGLQELSNIALKAREEIKMESLRNDYLWISETFKVAFEFLP